MSIHENQEWTRSDWSWVPLFTLFMGAWVGLLDNHASPLKTTAIGLVIAVGAYGCWTEWRVQAKAEKSKR